ncbi:MULTISPECIES: MFS transporter [Arthrobacter]|uniref:Lysosomal dipeptide transporter MFSD1 n=2 Tax=Arthrobacter TaxID=1663 RepID=A0ABU9KKU3_9MICC|nr:MFS transporter [Arthrobacter sp. YJM1]MDP5226167.1 MFS transporter [Arthrobacter sp. YJM1]
MRGMRSWLVWGVGVFAYLVAVTQRTSFGIAGLEATQRFHASAAAISAFSVLQLLVYAGLQIPVGVLVDRLGPRLMIAGGAVLMCLGQAQLAAADSVSAGVVGRVLVGAGDAATFISVLRLLPAWFPARRVPLLTQFTGVVGQTGQLISVIPFAWLLHSISWTPAFLSLASLSALACVLVLLLLRDTPEGRARTASHGGLTDIRRALAASWKEPGTRLGLWSHFTTPFAGTVFALAWGYPFLISAQGLDRATASTVMSIYVLVSMVAGPFFGRFVSLHPVRRSSMVLLVSFLTGAGWLVVLLWPGRSPLWLLIGLVVVMGFGGPASMIGFDFARTSNPVERIGTATGIVNVGGFVAALLSMYVIGLVLDLLNAGGFSHGELYGLQPFRIALATQFFFLAVGSIAVAVVRRRARREAGISPRPLARVLWERTRQGRG